MRTALNETVFSGLLGLALLAAGCQTTKGSEGDLDPHRKTHYTLRYGTKTVHPAPLGTQTDVLIDWHHADGATSTVEGFRGWDFDGDGRFEMLEVLSEDGAVASRVYDFDADGSIDWTAER